MGALIFTGLDALTGYGTFSLAIPSLPAASAPTLAEFGWALAIGVAAAGLSAGLRWLALRVRDGAGRRLVPVTTLLGLVMAGLAILYAQLTGHPASNVLFSGQAALPGLIDHSADYTVGALVLLLVCKGLAYVAALSGFRGGPTFPAMFIGAAGGIALSHLPGLSLVAGVAMGLAAMTVGMLRLPMSAVLLTTLFLGSDGFAVMPLVIVATVVCYLTANRLAAEPQPVAAPAPERSPAPPVPRQPLSSPVRRVDRVSD